MTDGPRERGASAQPPDDTATVRLAPASKAAGGFGALTATMRYAQSQTGLVRGTRVLARTVSPG